MDMFYANDNKGNALCILAQHSNSGDNGGVANDFPTRLYRIGGQVDSRCPFDEIATRAYLLKYRHKIHSKN